MSKLSKKKSIKRKHQRKKERNKPEVILQKSEIPELYPDVEFEKGLKVTTVSLLGIHHKPIKVGNCVYKSATDFSTDKGWVKYWGRAFDITQDIHGNYVVYWKERFPLFDEFDYKLDGRHYRIMLLCSSKEEADRKRAFLQQNNLYVSAYEHKMHSFREDYAKKEYRFLLPLVLYEDGVRAIVVEIQENL